MNRLTALALIVVVTALPSCGENRESPSGLVAGVGAILGGGPECGWMVQADSGRLYELTGLAAEFQQQELRVRFTLKTRSDIASICMRGATADVLWMRKL